MSETERTQTKSSRPEEDNSSSVEPKAIPEPRDQPVPDRRIEAPESEMCQGKEASREDGAIKAVTPRTEK